MPRARRSTLDEKMEQLAEENKKAALDDLARAHGLTRLPRGRRGATVVPASRVGTKRRHGGSAVVEDDEEEEVPEPRRTKAKISKSRKRGSGSRKTKDPSPIALERAKENTIRAIMEFPYAEIALERYAKENPSHLDARACACLLLVASGAGMVDLRTAEARYNAIVEEFGPREEDGGEEEDGEGGEEDFRSPPPKAARTTRGRRYQAKAVEEEEELVLSEDESDIVSAPDDDSEGKEDDSSDDAEMVAPSRAKRARTSSSRSGAKAKKGKSAKKKDKISGRDPSFNMLFPKKRGTK